MGFMGLLLIPVIDVLGFVLSLYFKIVVVDVVLYWMLQYKLVTIHNKYAEKFVEILKKLTEPVYAKIRAKIKPFADFDASPFILLLILYFIGQLLNALAEAVI